eukprot:355420-Prorocentrum_minimum.AAC.1
MWHCFVAAAFVDGSVLRWPVLILCSAAAWLLAQVWPSWSMAKPKRSLGPPCTWLLKFSTGSRTPWRQTSGALVRTSLIACGDQPLDITPAAASAEQPEQHRRSAREP